MRILDSMGVDYKVFVEPQEVDEYSKNINYKKIVMLPFSNLGKGSTPARNFILEYSRSRNEERHWILDDNIEGFNRLNRNKKLLCKSPAIFRASEDFTDRYENIALSGFNYYSFCKSTDPVPAFYLNTRVYSCILVNNLIPYKWRGKYNEDTDLSIRLLKDGWCTVLFNAFLCGKVTTQRMKGGNTDNVYTDNDNRYRFAKSLQERHPDVVKVTKKFGRWHHHVNYSPFKKNRLIKKEGLKINDNINEYNMRVVKNEHQKTPPPSKLNPS